MAEDLTRWEYKYWTGSVYSTPEQEVNELNKLGNEGWELTGARSNTKPGLLLKRQKVSNQLKKNVPPYNPPQR